MKRIFFLFLAILLISPTSKTTLAFNNPAYNKISSFRPENEWQPRCEEIHIDYCKDMKYNQTILPNLLNHHKQKDADEELSQYKHLMTSHCNPYLNVFLCSLFVPVCTIYFKPIPPCRPLCYEVQADCEPLMKTFKYSWPSIFECSQFPESGMCVGENLTQVSTHENKNKLINTPKRPYNKIKSEINKESDYKEILYSMFYDVSESSELQCPLQSQVPLTLKYKLNIGQKTLQNCGLPCHPFFTPSKTQLASQLVGWMSVVCLIATTLTIFSFLLDTDRFGQPERCVVAMVGCYGAVCLAYFVGFIFGDHVSCVGATEGGLVETQGSKNEYCSLVFLLTNYFGMAAHVWWVLLCVSWLLSTGIIPYFKSINPLYLHLIAWSLPALTTIAVLAIGNVEGDSLVGICYVGLSNPRAFKLLVITPLIIYLLLGVIFLLGGLVSLHRIKGRMQKEKLCTVELEKSVIRMAIFAVLFCLPAATVIACHFYELEHRMNWMMGWYLQHYPQSQQPQQLELLVNKILNSPNHFNLPNHPNTHILSPANNFQSYLFHQPFSLQPFANISIFRHMMTLIVAIFISIWLSSAKTITILKQKFVCCHGNVGRDGGQMTSPSTDMPASKQDTGNKPV